jgi:hypothetical protein
LAEFETNLMRAQLAATWFSVCLQASQDLFGRGYLSLSLTERAAVEQIVLTQVGVHHQAVTPEWLTAQQARPPMGFQAATGTQPAVPTSTPPIQP